MKQVYLKQHIPQIPYSRFERIRDRRTIFNCVGDVHTTIHTDIYSVVRNELFRPYWEEEGY